MDSVTRSRKKKITPFWNRIPLFFLYGLYPGPLFFAIGLGIVALFLSSWWAYLILYAMATKYSMAALQQTARGKLEPPEMNSETLVNGYGLPLTLFFIFLLYFSFLGSLASSMGYFVTLIVYGLGVFLFPAMIICLGISESLTFSINPANLINLVRAIGWPYLALYGMIFSLGGAQSTLESFALADTDTDTMIAMWLSINTIFSIIGFHMMGYVAMQYHEELGEPEPDSDSHENTSPRVMAGSPLLDQFISEGNTAAATAELRALIQQDPENMELRRRLHNYALVTNQPDALKRNAKELMEQAVKCQKTVVATQVFSDCRDQGLLCHPDRADAHLPILKELRAQRRFKDAVALAKGFHTRFPDNEDTPAVYLELARVFSEDLQRDDLADQLLSFVLKHFAQHPVTVEAKQYLEVIKQLNQSNLASKTS
ncbi:MAG: energy-coupling factor transporter transmembrane protein EcfT [Chromatiales bacterium]|nr:energy-coupling factor transporter transmembrane protein EcfT [Chromatiales bacterium]